MPEFIPGIELNRAFYHEAVRPILDAHFSGLAHSAALVGYGSDVLGLDTPTSTDHLWGPRLLLFLRPEDLPRQGEILEALRYGLPVTFRGFSTHFGLPDAADGGVRVSEMRAQGPVDPLIFFHTLESFWQQELGLSPFQEPSPAAWLTLQQHRLLSVTGGAVYQDDLGLEAARARFAYYPGDIWRCLLAAQWELIGQEEAFVGRAAQAGDELGSRVVAARLVERLVHLCFLMERRYAPYSKWLGSAFRRLACAPQMGPLLEGALSAPDYPVRERFLAQAYTLAAGLHNALGLTPPLEPRTRTYSAWHALRGGIQDLPLDHPRNTRPHQVIFARRFVEALLQSIRDSRVRQMAGVYGSVNQFLVESSPAQQSVSFCRALEPLLQTQSEQG